MGGISVCRAVWYHHGAGTYLLWEVLVSAVQYGTTMVQVRTYYGGISVCRAVWYHHGAGTYLLWGVLVSAMQYGTTMVQVRRTYYGRY